MATIANVQAAKYGSVVSNSVTLAWNNTPTSGNILVARARGVAATDGGAITGWTRVDYARYGATTGYVSIFVKIAGASEGNVTVTFTSATTTMLVIEEWSSSTGWVGADQYAHSDNSGTAVTSKSSGTTGTTTAADELAVSVIGWGNAVTNISWSNSFVESFARPTGTLTFAGAHKVLSTTGTVETTATWMTSRIAGAAIATFKVVNSVTLTIADANHSLTTDAISLTVEHNLEIPDAAHILTTDSITLSVEHNLVVDDATHTHAADNITLTITTDLAITDAAHTLTSDNLTLWQTYAEVFTSPKRVTQFEAGRRDLEYSTMPRVTNWKVKTL